MEEVLLTPCVTYFRNSIEFVSNLTLSDVIMTRDKLHLLILETVLWTLLYTFVHNLPIFKESEPKKALDSKNRIVSIIHASVAFIWSTIDYIYFQSDKCGSKNSEFQNHLLIFSCSYFIYDILASIYFGILDQGMLIHHLFVIFSEYCGIVFNNSASEMIRALVSAEVSNPIMHIRKILSNSRLADTKIHLYLEYIYFGLYIFSRMIFGVMITIWTVFCMDNLFMVKIGGTLVIVQSMLYTLNMIGIIKLRVKEYKERSKESVKLYWFSVNEKIKKLDYKKKKTNKEGYVP